MMVDALFLSHHNLGNSDFSAKKIYTSKCCDTKNAQREAMAMEGWDMKNDGINASKTPNRSIFRTSFLLYFSLNISSNKKLSG